MCIRDRSFCISTTTSTRFPISFSSTFLYFRACRFPKGARPPLSSIVPSPGADVKMNCVFRSPLPGTAPWAAHTRGYLPQGRHSPYIPASCKNAAPPRPPVWRSGACRSPAPAYRFPSAPSASVPGPFSGTWDRCTACLLYTSRWV